MPKASSRPNGFAQKITKVATWSFLSMLFLIIIGATIFFFATFKQYVNEKEGWSLYYPKTWQMQDTPMPGRIAAFVAPKNNPLDFFNDNIAITYTDLSKKPISLQEYVDTAKRQMAATFQDVLFVESRKLNISRHPGAKLVFQTKPDTNLTFVIYTFIFNDVAYNITYSVMTEHYQKNGRYLFEAMMATLKVIF